MKYNKLCHIPTQKCLDITAFSVTEESGKYDKKIHKAYYKNVRIFKTSHYKVDFFCPCCNAIGSTLLSNFIRKLNSLKNIDNFACESCDVSKKVQVIVPCKNKIPNNKNELYNLLPYLNLQHIDIENFEYIPQYGSKNDNYPILRNKYCNSIIQLKNMYCTCNSCYEVCFMKKLKLTNKMLLCPDCSQTLYTKPKFYSTSIYYFTIFQLKFIKFCSENDITISNTSLFVSNIKPVLFYLNELDIFIDIKSNLFYNNNEKLYKFESIVGKHIRTELFAEYYIIHPKNYLVITRKILELCKKNTSNCTTRGLPIHRGGLTQVVT